MNLTDRERRVLELRYGLVAPLSLRDAARALRSTRIAVRRTEDAALEKLRGEGIAREDLEALGRIGRVIGARAKRSA